MKVQMTETREIVSTGDRIVTVVMWVGPTEIGTEPY